MSHLIGDLYAAQEVPVDALRDYLLLLPCQELTPVLMEQEEEELVRDQLIIAVAQVVTDQVRDIGQQVSNLQTLVLVGLLSEAL